MGSSFPPCPPPRYFTPSILQLAGVGNQAALLLAMLPALTNALGTLVGMRAIDRAGRRRLLLASIAAVAVALAALGSAFLAAERHSPAVLASDGSSDGSGGGGGSTCPAAAADCTACLRSGCGFCGGSGGDLMAPGACMAMSAQQAAAADSSSAELGGCAPPARLFLHGCPSRHTWLILLCLVTYLAAFSPGAAAHRPLFCEQQGLPACLGSELLRVARVGATHSCLARMLPSSPAGLGPVPWAVNAEIYPLQVRGIATGGRGQGGHGRGVSKMRRFRQPLGP